MIVKSLSHRKAIRALVLSLLIGSMLSLAAFITIEKPDKKLQDQQNVLAVRAIGDDLLRSVDNFRSPVSPVQKTSDNALKLIFEEPFSLDPDQLVDIALKHLTFDISSRSIVSVFDADNDELVYGFEINHFNQKEIPCLGRIFPESQYYVEIDLYERAYFGLKENAVALSFTGFSLLSFALFGFSASRKINTYSGVSQTHVDADFELDRLNNLLVCNGTHVDLTDKEFSIMSVLYQHKNQLVTRRHIEETVWLSEGVITSRSLDMYISRLRKKLSVIPTVQINNKRGKGYILEVGG